jgi:hypothetical protein
VKKKNSVYSYDTTPIHTILYEAAPIVIIGVGLVGISKFFESGNTK